MTKAKEAKLLIKASVQDAISEADLGGGKAHLVWVYATVKVTERGSDQWSKLSDIREPLLTPTDKCNLMALVTELESN